MQLPNFWDGVRSLTFPCCGPRSANASGSRERRPHARMFIPPPSNPNAKLGFSTYAMWALCVVVVGVCYKLEQNELAARPASPAGIPDTVQKVMPSGAWLMSAPRPSALIVVIPLMRHTVVGRGRLDPEGQLNRTKLLRCHQTSASSWVGLRAPWVAVLYPVTRLSVQYACGRLVVEA